MCSSDLDDVPEVWARLLAMGVDGLDTARPAAAEPLIAAENARRAALAAATTTSPPQTVPTLPATGGAPVVPALGAAVVIGIGAALRRASSRR